jgi:hypothetical protein
VTLAPPPLLRVHLLSFLVRRSGGFLPFVGLDDERVHRCQHGELTLGRGVLSRKIFQTRIIHRALPGAYG